MTFKINFSETDFQLVSAEYIAKKNTWRITSGGWASLDGIKAEVEAGNFDEAVERMGVRLRQIRARDLDRVTDKSIPPFGAD